MLCLIQCGETAWESEERIHGSTDIPLSEAGRLAVTADVQRMKTDRVAMVHHPNDEAATDTAQAVARKLGAKTKGVAELADPNMGLLEGLHREEFAERYPSRFRQWVDEPMMLTPPEGENLAEASSRILGTIAHLLKRSRSEEVAIVLHPLALGMARCWFGARRSNDLWLMLKNRPRIERYAMTAKLVSDMEQAAAAIVAPS